jgi:hypothetical protein
MSRLRLPECPSRGERALRVERGGGRLAPAPDPLACLGDQRQQRCESEAGQPLPPGERDGEQTGLEAGELGRAGDQRDRDERFRERLQEGGARGASPQRRADPCNACATPACSPSGTPRGRADGPATSGRSRPPPVQAIGDALTALGFQPRIDHHPDGRLSCRLTNCPYRDSVRADQAVVCTLHRGLTRGLIDRLAPTATLERFVPHDPDRAGCELDIDGLAPAAG